MGHGRLDRPRRTTARYRPRDLILSGREALRRHKLRSGLSILGVVLGIAAITSMMSVSLGARDQVLRQVDLLGLSNIIVRTEPETSRTGRGLAFRDVSRLRQLLPRAEVVTPLINRYAQIQGPVRTRGATVIGVEAVHAPLMRLATGRGRFLSTIDDDANRRVCVLGAGLTQSIFGYRDPIGNVIRVGDLSYRVVGVLERRSSVQSSLGPIAPRAFNEAVLVPLAVMLGLTTPQGGERVVDEVWVRAGRGQEVSELAARLDRALRWTRPEGGGYEVIVPEELLAQRYETQRTFGVVIGSVALISLVVGGIGIMNVMLASVIERTSEIGLRRTVGATRHDVMAQFLTESLMLTVMGGVLGVGLGIVTTSAIADYAGWPVRISFLALSLAISVSVVVGVVFGTYPAIRASRLQPIDAVRYE